MRYGKLSSDELLQNVLSKIQPRRKEVQLSAALGEDCAALKTEDFILLSSDPITAKLPPKELGELTVNVCANDIISNGGEPIAMLLTIIMPPDAQPSQIGEIMEGAESAAKSLNLEIVGGHTEFSSCVNYPITCGTAVGSAKKLFAKRDICAGDALVVTKSLCIEGSVILAPQSGVLWSEAELLELENYKAMLSVAKEGELCRRLSGVTSMHDVTEGGILGAVSEVCQSAQMGATVYEKALPITALTKKICQACGADPYRLISSGSLLITCKDAGEVISQLEKAGIKATQIGFVNPSGEAEFVRRDGAKEKFGVLPDELFRITGKTI